MPGAEPERHALLQRALGEKLTGRQIKESIRDWQPDYYRTIDTHFLPACAAGPAIHPWPASNTILEA